MCGDVASAITKCSFVSNFARMFGSRVAQASTRGFASYAEKTGALSSRLVPDAATLSSSDKTKLALIAAAGAVGLGTILYAGTQAGNKTATTANTAADNQTYPAKVRDRLMRTYGYFAGGIALTAAAATAFARNEAVVSFAVRRPYVFLIGSAVAGIGSMMGIYASKNQNVKRGFWLAFVTAQGATMVPIAFLGGPIVLQAAAATGLMIGSLSAVAAVSPSDSFLWMGGGLSIGLTCLVGASFASMFFPGSSILQNVALYGGLGLFGAMTLYDTQKVVQKAKLQTDENFDPIGDSLGLFLNTVNVFVRMVQIFSNQSNNNRRR